MPESFNKNFNTILTALHDVESKLDDFDLQILQLISYGNIPSYIARILNKKYKTVLYRVRKLINLGLIVRRKGYQGGYYYHLTLLGEAIVKKMKQGGRGAAGFVWGFENVGLYFVLDGAVDVGVLPFGFVAFGHRDGRVLGYRGRVEGCTVLVYPGKGRVHVYPPALRDSDVVGGFARMVIAAYEAGQSFIKKILHREIVEYGLVGKPQFVVDNDPFAEHFYREYGSVRGEDFDINDSHGLGPSIEFKNIEAAAAYSMLPEILKAVFDRLSMLEMNQVKIVQSLDKLTKIFERLLSFGGQDDAGDRSVKREPPREWY